MATFTIPNTFQGETPAVANEVNANFEAVKTYSIAVQNELNTINEAIADLDKKPVREVFAIYPSISSKTPTGAYPLWTGETITNARSLFPDFWSECLKRKTAGTIKTVASSAAYDEIVDDYGQCSSFFIDELNGHIRLPMLTRFISSISAVGDFGKLDKAGLPNIEGNVDGGRVNATTVTGAFSNNGSGWGRFDGGADQDTNFGNSSFSASSSNEIYGSSDTVQPESISLCWFIQVATNTADISEMNTDVIAEQLNQALLDLQAEYDRLKLLLDDYVANTSIPQVDSYLLNNIYPILTSEVGRAETAAQTAINNASKTAADKTAVGAYVTEVEALAVDIEEYKDSTLAAAALASADADSTSADRTAVEADKGLTLSYKNSAQQYAQESATAAGESENSATNAASSENEATAQAELALKYANGTITEYPDGSSKYWSEQAQRDVQADWNQTDSTEPSFIQNKPDISDVESLTSDVAELQAQLSLKANSSDVVNLTDNQTITGLKSVPTPTADEHISNKGSVGIKAYTSTVPFSLNDVVLNVEDGEVKLYKSLIANNTSALTTEDWEEVSLGGGSSYQLFSQVPMTTALDADIPELSNALLHQLDGSSLPSTGIYSEAFRIAGLLKAKGVE